MPATDHYFRNIKKVHAAFAVSMVILLVSSIMMMYEDQNDEWRDYQRTGYQLDAAVQRQQKSQIETDEYLRNKAQLEAVLAQENQRLDEVKATNPEPFESLAKAERELEALALQLKSQKAISTELISKKDEAVRDSLPADEAKWQARLDEQNAVVARLTEEVADSTARVEAAKAAVKVLTADADAAKAAVDALLSESNRLAKSLEKIDPDTWYVSLKRTTMEWPIIDGFNSHLKEKQDWLPDLHLTLGMTKIARFDRCRTCHMNIDRTASGNVPAFPEGHPDTEDVADWVAENEFPQPYATHPQHDLYATASSPHPVSKFGCTICHDGQGSGTGFSTAEHRPNDPHMQEEWEKEHHFHGNHYWEYPMQPSRFIESSCIKCHHDVTELGVNPRHGASAPKVYEGYMLIRRYGCYGCHEINGYESGKSIGPDLRLEPQTDAAYAALDADPTAVPGTLRKAGPALRHLASKASRPWIEFWTDKPGQFRPSTKMPQFFHLTNLQDAKAERYQPVEVAGIAHFLLKNSQPLDLLKPDAEYLPDVARGKQFMAERGCLGCHTHSAFDGIANDFGPNISDIHLKVNRNAGNPAFSDWLYTWVKEPERYHPRSQMPNLYLDAFTTKAGEAIDPAADITAYLLSLGDPGQYTAIDVNQTDLDDIVVEYLSKARLSKEQAKAVLTSRQFPRAADSVKGDEVVLATADGAAVSDPAEWEDRKLEYIGRKTITRYGCYGCHDIPGYEDARPIGVALQDWGVKDTSKLGLEHIEQFLKHHGEPPDSKFESTEERVEDALIRISGGGFEKGQFASEEQQEAEMSAAYFYESLLHHGRPGFFWQKLRDPRSYDYEKTEVQTTYDERLRMPKFNLSEQEIEAIATFVLGLTADPPTDDYIYVPDEREKARIDGEFLIAKFNCTACHMLELPEITYGANLESIFATPLGAGDFQEARDMLTKYRPPRPALTGETRTFDLDGENVELPLARFHGLQLAWPDPEDDPIDREASFNTWETLDFGTGEEAKRVLSGSLLLVPELTHVDTKASRGGQYAEWLMHHLMDNRPELKDKRNEAWQASVPPLIGEGLKVQTPWLYEFLLEPQKIRHTTVLRMPRFKMRQHEARILANYFAAVDGAPFPYEDFKSRDPDYLATRNELLSASIPPDSDYLLESWKALNGNLCIGCHSVGGRDYVPSDPKKDIRGPNLLSVENRLREDWVKVWVYEPKRLVPYTSMPANFSRSVLTNWPDIFGGDPEAHVIAVRDALMNYTRLAEAHGFIVYTPPKVESAEGAENAPAASEE